MDDARALIRKIVDGQIETFFHAYPHMAEGWARQVGTRTKVQAVRDSLGKRITGALACEETLVRLRSALLIEGRHDEGG